MLSGRLYTTGLLLSQERRHVVGYILDTHLNVDEFKLYRFENGFGDQVTHS